MMKRLTTAIMVTVLCAAMMMSFVHAVDLTREGSLTVVLEYNRGALDNIGISIYFVADALDDTHGGVRYELTAPFAGSNADLTADLTVPTANNRLVGTLTSHISQQSRPGNTPITPTAGGTTDANGEATFTGLKAGLYLVTQSSGNGSYRMGSFVVMVPLYESDSSFWNFLVTVRPKSERDTPDDNTTTTETTSNTTTSTEPPPPPDETDIPDEPPPLIDIDEPDIPFGDLPQTGVVRWPVPVFGGGGMVLISLGWIVTRKEKGAYDKKN